MLDLGALLRVAWLFNFFFKLKGYFVVIMKIFFFVIISIFTPLSNKKTSTFFLVKISILLHIMLFYKW